MSARTSAGRAHLSPRLLQAPDISRVRCYGKTSLVNADVSMGFGADVAVSVLSERI